MANQATVYLIPAPLAEDAPAPMPPAILEAVRQCEVFFVENERSARRYLKSLDKSIVIDDYEWFTIHKAEGDVRLAFDQRLAAGKTIGIISEAGCPGVADPGQVLTMAAHRAGATVRPLIGPSSILLAVMSSGLNGQQFRFCGYLPVDGQGRAKALRELEQDAQARDCTQVWIETPYRNNQMLETILSVCRPSTRICIAANLTAPNEFIRTRTVAEWRKAALPDLHKQPVVFCLLG